MKERYVWVQRTGALYDPAGAQIATGYSGFSTSRNVPEDEAKPGLGPIPRGLYRIGAEEDSDTKGPVMMRLVPLGHDAQGRSGFEIHGDSKLHPGAASHGCIILPRPIREHISDGDCKLLEVVAETPVDVA